MPTKREAVKGEPGENPKNLKYEVTVFWDKESGGNARIKGYPLLPLDTPVEFGGKGRFPCPDEIFYSAIGGCLINTFLYFKRRLDLDLKGLRVSVYGMADAIGPMGYRVTGIETDIRVEVDEAEKPKAERCAELVKEYCHLTRSIEKGIPIKARHKIETHISRNNPKRR